MNWWERLRARLGRRGLCLTLIGTVWIIQGYSILSGAGDRVLSPNPALFHLLIPIWIRVLLWVGCGVVAFLGAIILTPRFQAVGFVALFIPPLERALSYAGGWAMAILTEDSGVPGAWSPATAWAVIALLIMVIAGWREEDPRMAGPRRDGLPGRST